MRRLLTLIISIQICSCAQLPPTAVSPPAYPRDQAVVTDIDGTLTPKNIALWEPRPNAAKALEIFSKKGYKIVYLTARSPLLQSGLPRWLRCNGFPLGSLHTAQTADDRRHPDKFKARLLADYKKAGWHLTYAYGDSSTDFVAYAEAKIPREHVFAFKRRGETECQKGVYHECLEGWTEHLTYIERKVTSAQ